MDEELDFQLKNIQKGVCHVLAIAMDDYAGLKYGGRDIAPLTKPRADAAAFFGVLKEKYDGFSDGNWTLLAGEEAKPSAVEEALVAIFKKIKPADQVLIYYSGHGERDAFDIWNLLLYPEMESTTAAAMAFPTFFSKIAAFENCHSILLVLDGCHAGAVFQNVNSAQTKAPVYALTAARAVEVSFETHPNHEGFNSPFAEFLIKILDAGNGQDQPFSATNLKNPLQKSLDELLIKQQADCQLLGKPAIGGTQGPDLREFIFRLRGKNRPPIGDLKKLFLENLNFKRQRLVFEEGPDPDAPDYYDFGKPINFWGTQLPDDTNFHFLMKSLLGWVKTQRQVLKLDTRGLANPQILPVQLDHAEAESPVFDWNNLRVDEIQGDPGDKKKLLIQKVSDCLKDRSCIFILKTTKAAHSDAYLNQAVREIAEAILPKNPADHPLYILVCDTRPLGGLLQRDNFTTICPQSQSNFRLLPRFTKLGPLDAGNWVKALQHSEKFGGFEVVKNIQLDKLQVSDTAAFVEAALAELGHEKAQHDIFDFTVHSIFA